jgi:hypothetical protein
MIEGFNDCVWLCLFLFFTRLAFDTTFCFFLVALRFSFTSKLDSNYSHGLFSLGGYIERVPRFQFLFVRLISYALTSQSLCLDIPVVLAASLTVLVTNVQQSQICRYRCQILTKYHL